MSQVKNISDFIIRVIMIFTTVVTLTFFAGYYPKYSLIYGFLALLFILSMITKGLFDIFSKK